MTDTDRPTLPAPTALPTDARVVADILQDLLDYPMRGIQSDEVRAVHRAIAILRGEL